jgi:alpha 1,2-mannosyltransferase
MPPILQFSVPDAPVGLQHNPKVKPRPNTPATRPHILPEEPVETETVITTQPTTVDKETSNARANATIVMLARNEDILGALNAIQNLEAKFNHKYHYPWTLLNDVPFNDEFKR